MSGEAYKFNCDQIKKSYLKILLYLDDPQYENEDLIVSTIMTYDNYNGFFSGQLIFHLIYDKRNKLWYCDPRKIEFDLIKGEEVE